MTKSDKVVKEEILREDCLDCADGLFEIELELATILTEIKDQDLWKKWGHKTFTQYYGNELGLNYTHVNKLIRYRRWLDNFDGYEVESFCFLGMEICAELAQVVTRDSAKEWSRRINGKTVKEIRSLIKTKK